MLELAQRELETQVAQLLQELGSLRQERNAKDIELDLLTT